jgi:hypothetical protein
MPREKAQAATTARSKVPMRRRGADCLVLAMKWVMPVERRGQVIAIGSGQLRLRSERLASGRSLGPRAATSAHWAPRGIALGAALRSERSTISSQSASYDRLFRVADSRSGGENSKRQASRPRAAVNAALAIMPRRNGPLTRLEHTVTPIVMSLIGGTASWVGPLVGVVLLFPECSRPALS